MVKVGAVTLAVLGALGLGFYAYLGGFRSVAIGESQYGPVEFVFGTHRGSYSGISDSWDRLYSEVKSKGLEKCDALAVYLDGPQTPEEQLRSVLGCRIDGLPAADQVRLRAALPTVRLPAARTLHATFPFVNFLSYMIGPTRVYPAMHAHSRARSISPPLAIEVYGPQPTTGQVEFHMPLGAASEAYRPLYAAFESRP